MQLSGMHDDTKRKSEEALGNGTTETWWSANEQDICTAAAP